MILQQLTPSKKLSVIRIVPGTLRAKRDVRFRGTGDPYVLVLLIAVRSTSLNCKSGQMYKITRSRRSRKSMNLIYLPCHDFIGERGDMWCIAKGIGRDEEMPSQSRV